MEAGKLQSRMHTKHLHIETLPSTPFVDIYTILEPIKFTPIGGGFNKSYYITIMGNGHNNKNRKYRNLHSTFHTGKTINVVFIRLAPTSTFSFSRLFLHLHLQKDNLSPFQTPSPAIHSCCPSLPFHLAEIKVEHWQHLEFHAT